MRFADMVLRQGHLSDRALIEVCVTGDRPAHMDRCDLCAERSDVLGRWLDEVRTASVEAADAAFSAERLSAQQAQILRRLEQMDNPVRVIAFPGQSRSARLDGARRRIGPAWVGLGVAAGLVLGVVGGQITSQIAQRGTTPEASLAAVAASEGVSIEQAARVADIDHSLRESDIPQVQALEAIDQLTPHLIEVAFGTTRTIR